MSKATDSVQKARIANYEECIADLEEQLIQFAGDKEYLEFLYEQMDILKDGLEEIKKLG